MLRTWSILAQVDTMEEEDALTPKNEIKYQATTPFSLSAIVENLGRFGCNNIMMSNFDDSRDDVPTSGLDDSQERATAGSSWAGAADFVSLFDYDTILPCACGNVSFDEEAGKNLVDEDDSLVDEDEKAVAQVDSEASPMNNFLGRQQETMKQHRVRFAEKKVREFERVIDTSMYLGLNLGWGYVDKPPISMVDDPHDEPARKGIALGSLGGEFTKVKKTRPHERYHILLVYGFSRRNLKHAALQVTPAKTNDRLQRGESSSEEDEKIQGNSRSGTWASRRMLRIRHSWGR